MDDWVDGDFDNALAMYRAAGRQGWHDVRAMPQWQPGSPERQFTAKLLGMVVPVYDWYGALSGRDPIGGRKLGIAERRPNAALHRRAATGNW